MHGLARIGEQHLSHRQLLDHQLLDRRLHAQAPGWGGRRQRPGHVNAAPWGRALGSGTAASFPLQALAIGRFRIGSSLEAASVWGAPTLLSTPLLS